MPAQLRGRRLEVRLAREHAHLGVVEHHDVDARERLEERFARRLDPVVHRVETGDARVAALLAHAALEVRLDVREEHHRGVARGVRELRLEVGEDVELCLDRVRDLHVVVVAALPEEGPRAADALDVGRVDALGVEAVELVRAEVVAHDADHADVREHARRDREVRRGASEDALAAPERRLERVECDRADDGDRHTAPARVSAAEQAGGGTQRVGAIGALPREVRVAAAEVAVGGGRRVDRPAQVEVAHDRRRAEVEVLADELLDARLGDDRGAEALGVDRDRLRDADRVGHLHLAAVRETRGDDVLGHVARGVGGRAVDLRRVLAREGAAAVRRGAAVGVDDDLAAGEAGVAHRAAGHEAARRVDVHEVAIGQRGVVEQVRVLALEDRLDHVLDQVGLDRASRPRRPRGAGSRSSTRSISTGVRWPCSSMS